MTKNIHGWCVWRCHLGGWVLLLNCGDCGLAACANDSGVARVQTTGLFYHYGADMIDRGFVQM